MSDPERAPSLSARARTLALGAAVALLGLGAYVLGSALRSGTEEAGGAGPEATASLHGSAEAALAMSEAERALFAPLGAGAQVLGCEVIGMDGAARDGLLRVVFTPPPDGYGTRATSPITIVVARASDQPPPAAIAGPYALYYEAAPGDEPLAQRLATGLSRTLSRHLDLPIPVALRRYDEDRR